MVVNSFYNLHVHSHLQRLHWRLPHKEPDTETRHHQTHGFWCVIRDGSWLRINFSLLIHLKWTVWELEDPGVFLTIGPTMPTKNWGKASFTSHTPAGCGLQAKLYCLMCPNCPIHIIIFFHVTVLYTWTIRLYSVYVFMFIPLGRCILYAQKSNID